MPFFGGGGSAASNMVGATSSAAGTAGLVPAPAAGDQDRYLTGAGTFSNGDSAYVAPANAYGSSSSTNPTWGRPLYNMPMGMVNAPLYKDRLQFSWTKIPKGVTFSNIIYHVQANNNASGWDLGIYSNDSSSMKPSSLILSFSSLSCASTGVYDVSVSSSSLDSGDYWICAYSKANTNFTGGCDGSVWKQVGFRNGVFGGAALQWGINQASSTGNAQCLSWQALSYTSANLPTTCSSLTLYSLDAFAPFICVR